jgi:hypothetical protein
MYFWSRVVRGEGCWEWQGARNQDGYGTLWVDHRKVRAHRLAWEIVFGPIPAGLWVLHSCDNPPCCNPAHLWLGTPADNSADMVAKGRGRGGYNGFPLPYENQARGERSGSARLTEADVREIRASSLTQRELGRRYGVSQVAICKIRTRRTWAHVV